MYMFMGAFFCVHCYVHAVIDLSLYPQVRYWCSYCFFHVGIRLYLSFSRQARLQHNDNLALISQWVSSDYVDVAVEEYSYVQKI